MTLSVELPFLRRASLFGLAIGLPVAAGAIRHMPIVALPAAIFGLLLSFADDPGALPARLRALVLVATAMVIGALLAFMTRSDPIPFWCTALVGGIGVGSAVLAGGLRSLMARDAAIAFAIATILPSPTNAHVLFLAGVVALIVLARSVDHACFGALPALPAAPARSGPSTPAMPLHFAITYGVATAVALWIGRTFDPGHAPWVVISTLVVIQPDPSTSYVRALERAGGAILGVSAAWITLHITRATLPTVLCVVAIATGLPHHFKRRFWLHTALIAYMALLMYSLGTPGEPAIHKLLTERLGDMLAGCAIALAGTFAYGCGSRGRHQRHRSRKGSTPRPLI